VILNDKRNQELFANILSMRGRLDLRDKYMEYLKTGNSMSGADWMAMGAFRGDLLRRTGLLEEVRSNLDKDDLEYFLNSSPAFAFLRNSVEPDRAAELIKQHLEQIFTNASDFDIDRMVFAQRALRDVRMSEWYQHMRARAQKVTGDRNVRPENIHWGAIDPTIVSDMLKPTWNQFLFNGENRTRSALTVNAVTDNLNAMLNIVAASVSRDPQLRADMVRAGLEQRGLREAGSTGITSYAETQKVREETSEAALRAKIISKKFKDEFKTHDGKTWAQSSPEEREEEVFAPLEAAAESRESSRGWFTSWLSSVWDSILGRTRQNLRNEGLFANAPA
jgi:hypothetical protein